MTNAASVGASEDVSEGANEGSTRAWVWAGSFLIASAVVGLGLAQLQTLVGGSGGLIIVWVVVFLGRACFAAAMWIFALGCSGRGSIVARQPLGVAALLVFGLWPVVTTAVGLVLGSSQDMIAVYQVFSYVDLAVSLSVGLVAVVAIARARVVPDRWRFAPAWGFGVIVGLNVLVQGAGVALLGSADPGTITVLFSVLGLVTTVIPLLLGLLAIVLGLRGEVPQPTRHPVQVYPPVE